MRDFFGGSKVILSTIQSFPSFLSRVGLLQLFVRWTTPILHVRAWNGPKCRSSIFKLGRANHDALRRFERLLIGCQSVIRLNLKFCRLLLSLAPSYLSDLVNVNKPVRCSRSSDIITPSYPRSRLKVER